MNVTKEDLRKQDYDVFKVFTSKSDEEQNEIKKKMLNDVWEELKVRYPAKRKDITRDQTMGLDIDLHDGAFDVLDSFVDEEYMKFIEWEIETLETELDYLND